MPTACSDARDRLNTCAVFDVAEAAFPDTVGGGRRPPFRDPAGLDILRCIADGLARSGYRMGAVKPAVGIEAACRCRLESGFDLLILLGVSRRRGRQLTCDVITRCRAPVIGRVLRRLRDDLLAGNWEQLCLSINDQLLRSVGATSVCWLTYKSAVSRWAEDEAEEMRDPKAGGSH
jgi:hypothetical protein